MSDRYDRQVRLFGADGHGHIQAAHIVLLGTGGNGMHVVQQLAYAGVRRWTFVEFDKVENTNLNRLVGATPDDIGVDKIDIATRLVKSIHPEAKPSQIRGHFGDSDIQDDVNAALASATLVIGCFDLERPRLEAVNRCSQAGVPYSDLATEILPADDARDLIYGGRVVFSHDGTGCLSCLGIIDMAALAREQMTDTQRAERDKMYGLGSNQLASSGPSVVTINGVVASLACTEALVFITGLREPARQLTYLGQTSIVRTNSTRGLGNCLYCNRWRQQLT
jgi:molybdopterin-synthase adenylyltransferase